MDILGQLGRSIVEMRRRKGLSREALARRAGLSPRFLAEVESGCGNIAFSRLHDVATALEEPLAALVASIPAAHHASGAKRKRVVALVGLRGAGKTTIGRKLAARLRRQFTELDALIEDTAGLTLPNIFEVHGESYYRQLEREVLESFLSGKTTAVLATGGGLVTNEDTYAFLRNNCVTIWLKAHPQDHWSRVLAQDPRPMAGDPNAMQNLQAILRRREPLYALADFAVDTSQLGLAGSVDEVLRHLKSL
jgi:XRE family aerobic/anaerobic benzoate catabolism transcriptional regulator